jgi:hypothetical protein
MRAFPIVLCGCCAVLADAAMMQSSLLHGALTSMRAMTAMRATERDDDEQRVVVPPQRDSFRKIFDGKDLTGWQGDTAGYSVVNGELHCTAKGTNLWTKDRFGDFHLRFDFKLTPGANNGLGIRMPGDGDAAYVGMELQILDDGDPQYATLHPWQYHGSIYGVVAAKRGHLKPVGEWNAQEVIVRGSRVKVVLNGVTIVDADVQPFADGGTPDGKDHPGLRRQSGFIGFLGHGHGVWFKDIELKELK